MRALLHFLQFYYNSISCIDEKNLGCYNHGREVVGSYFHLQAGRKRKRCDRGLLNTNSFEKTKNIIREDFGA